MKNENEKDFIDADTLRRRLENPTIRRAFLTLIAKKIGTNVEDLMNAEIRISEDPERRKEFECNGEEAWLKITTSNEVHYYM